MRRTKIELNNQTLTERILQVKKIPNAMVVQSRLLSGDYHYQTIGKASDDFVVTCELTEEEKERLQDAFLNVEAVSLTWFDKEYVGKMEQMPACEIVISHVENRLYSATFTLICPRG